jgi:dihydroorotase
MKILIKNGRVIDPASNLDEICDVVLAAGRIVAIKNIAKDFAPNKTIDASGCIVAPGLVDLSVHLREPGHEHEGMLESEMAAAVAGGVTSVVCPPDTDPVLDEPGLVEMLKFRAEKLHQSRVFPLGALTRNLQGEVLTEMVELTEAGCVGFSQADVALGNTQVLQRAAGHAPRLERGAGGGRDDCPAHHSGTGAQHRCARTPVPPEQRGRRRAGAPGQGRRPAGLL